MLNKVYILIADDHHAIRSGVKIILTTEIGSVEIGEAHNGAQALEQLRRLHWNLVILDIDLPVKNGYEVLESIRKENIKVPVIVFSLHNHPSIERKVMDMGAAAFLSKEVPPSKVVERVKQILLL